MVLNHSIETFKKNISLLVVFSLTFLFALLVPILAGTPTYNAMGGVYLRFLSIPDMTALEKVVIVISFLISNFLMSFGIVAINLIVKASKDNSKFGMFEGKMWQYIKALHNYIVSPFTTRVKCDVIGICAQKDLDVEKIMNKGQTKHIEYESAGARPGGATNLTSQFNTIVFINKTEKGEKHYFHISS